MYFNIRILREKSRNRVYEQNNNTFSALSVQFISSRKEFLFVNNEPKYLKVFRRKNHIKSSMPSEQKLSGGIWDSPGYILKLKISTLSLIDPRTATCGRNSGDLFNRNLVLLKTC